MAINTLEINEFLKLGETYPILDVRSPIEYNKAHIPGAYSFALFTDDERSEVGTIYKTKGREEAIKRGLGYFGIGMVLMVEDAEKILIQHKSKVKGDFLEKIVLIHCWRGGMRSAGVGWLLDLYGFTVYVLKGGYKSYRNYVLRSLTEKFRFNILGGYTGSGKTDVLKHLKLKGEPVLDLEDLAGHRGSAFGSIELPPQPTQEMFENKLIDAIRQLINTEAIEFGEQIDINRKNKFKRIWIEDESQRIGTVNLPLGFWQNLREQPVMFIEIPFGKRLDYLVETYGKFDRSLLIASISRIQKRLGGLETKTAIINLLENNIVASFEILLKYYDKLYKKALINRSPSVRIDFIVMEEISPKEAAIILLKKND